MTKPPIANDYPSIAQRMAQIERNRLLARFVMPEGVALVLYGTAVHTKIKQEQARDVEMCLVLRERVIYLVKSRSNGFVTQSGVDMLHYIATLLPSAKMTAATEITLSSADAMRLTEILNVPGV